MYDNVDRLMDRVISKRVKWFPSPLFSRKKMIGSKKRRKSWIVLYQPYLLIFCRNHRIRQTLCNSKWKDNDEHNGRHFWNSYCLLIDLLVLCTIETGEILMTINGSTTNLPLIIGMLLLSSNRWVRLWRRYIR